MNKNVRPSGSRQCQGKITIPVRTLSGWSVVYTARSQMPYNHIIAGQGTKEWECTYVHGHDSHCRRRYWNCWNCWDWKNGATLAKNRLRGKSYQSHSSPSPAYIYLSPPPPTFWYHQLYTILETTSHYYLVKYPLAIFSDHPFDVSFPISLAKCRFTTFVLSCVHLGSLIRMLNGTCCSRLPSRKMLPSKSFRSEPSLFYPSLISISICGFC